MNRFPVYVRNAVRHVLDTDTPGFAEHWLVAFEEAWGGFDEKNLARVLAEVAPQHALERLFVLCALGSLGTLYARDRLAEHLASNVTLERWASAIALGMLRDERSIGALAQMLTEYHPPSLLPVRPDQGFHSDWPYTVPRVLADWGRREAIPALAEGLRYAIYEAQHAQDASTPEARRVVLAQVTSMPIERFAASEERDWREYQFQQVYALGRLGGWSELAGIEGVEESRLKIWRIHLTVGALAQQYPINRGAWLWKSNSILLAKVKDKLVEHFGARLEDYEAALRDYELHRPPPIRAIDLIP